ncbi:toxin-antitoxin system, antitoxin component [Pseudomonas fluorescens]|uniref:Toxin-antitoxin system, antitoxin component n=1 Tax=Pseudomonas fluorescens TaxID=294 RepID=A0A327N7M8_PSEFL|nr:antitoxin Xre/MbcA/ParS toxin-binding domain-containing protein [Pseudomonas fluorescens]RAI70845.1 toxin-antitoxin system, antitoxin component [Pseudomonas fluorescens]
MGIWRYGVFQSSFSRTLWPTCAGISARVSTVESDQIYALVTLLNAAIELFEGDPFAVRQWMKSPARGLNSRAPLDMMATRLETQAVIDVIGQLEHGVGGEW